MTDMDERLGQLCRRAIAGKVFPGCCVGYLRDGRAAVLPFGRLTYDADSPTVRPETVYDVASVTKAVPTAALMLKLIEAGRAGLDDQVIDYLPELRNKYREKILIRHILTYTVVFDYGKSLSELARENPEDLLNTILSAPLREPPGTSYLYTNTPAILLARIIERIYGEPLNKVAERTLLSPLGMQNSTFTPAADKVMIAPSELTGSGELRGEVHDDSARALAASGVFSGAAGLFSTAPDLLTFAQMLLDNGEYRGTRIFKPESIKLMHTNQLKFLSERAGLGWDINQPQFMGEQASGQAFGKTGFTGCLLLVDPVKRAAMVHLSNRTYPKRPENNESINAFRRELANLILRG